MLSLDAPVCLELLGDRAVLERFVSDHARDLDRTTMIIFEGIALPTPKPAATKPDRLFATGASGGRRAG
jgi:hypothetical protein